MVKYKSLWMSKTLWAALGLAFVALWNTLAQHFKLTPFPNEVYAPLVGMLGYGIRTANTTILLPGQQPPVQTPDNVVPSSPAPQPAGESATPADPTPAPTPAPVAAPVPGDPDMLNLMTLLTAALSTGSTPPASGQLPALASWVDQTLPVLRSDVQAVGVTFNMTSLIKLANDTMLAANKLEAVFAGLDRAEVVAVTVRFVATTFAPPAAQAWLAPVLASGALENLIEGLYRAAFPPQVTAPVTNAPELPSGAAVTQ